MFAAVIEFSAHKDAEKAMNRLWDKAKAGDFYGEVQLHQMPEGVWRLEILSERAPRHDLIERLGGRVLDVAP